MQDLASGGKKITTRTHLEKQGLTPTCVRYTGHKSRGRNTLRPYIILGDQSICSHFNLGSEVFTGGSRDNQNASTFCGARAGEDAQSLHPTTTMRQSSVERPCEAGMGPQMGRDFYSQSNQVIDVLDNCVNLYIYVFHFKQQRVTMER